MNTSLIEIRRAKAPDAAALASTHDDAWRTAYQGIIPGPELDKLINRRGAEWWEGAIRKGSRISILAFGDTLAGAPRHDQMPSVPLMRRRIAGVERDRAPVLPLGGFPIPRIKVERKCQRRVRLGEVFVQGQSLGRSRLRLRKCDALYAR